MKNEKILVTGGAGFIGSHIVDRYISIGHKVVVIDNLSTGFKKNINKKAKFYNIDINNIKAVKKIINKEKPHIINHHAAIAEVVKSLKNPIPTYKSNILGTINLLLAGGQIGIKRFIFSSTGGAIYGEPDKIPATEKTPAIPLSPYGFSKFIGEECIKFYARMYGFNYLIFRYPNVYGPRQNPHGEAGVVAIFSELIKNNKRPTIFGDGTKARDYVYVDDITKANIIALKNGKNEIINLGWGEKISDQIVFDAIANIINFKKKPIYAPCRTGEVYQIALSAEKAGKILNWKPTISFKEGIKKYIKIAYPYII